MLILISTKYKYSRYGIGFYRHGTFSVGNGFGKNVIIFGADMCSSVHVDNKKIYIPILAGGTTQRLDDTTLTAERKYSINFTKHNKKSCLSLHHNGANSYLCVNDVKIIKFKTKDSEIKATPLYLGNVSKDFSVDNMKKTGLNGYIYDFSVAFDVIAVDDKLDIHKYIMKNREDIDRNKMIYNVTLHHHKKVCNSCTIFIVLLIITSIRLMGISWVYIYFY